MNKTLSDQIMHGRLECIGGELPVEAVKSFIKQLDNYCDLLRDGTHSLEVQEKILWIQNRINKLAGDKLI